MWRRQNQSTTFHNTERTWQHQLIGEHIALVQGAVAIGIFQNHDKAIGVEFIAAFYVLHKAAHFHDP